MRSLTLFLFCSGLMLGAAFGAESAAPPAFTRKPVATKAGDKVKIDFAVSRECDVSVFVEDAGGGRLRRCSAIAARVLRWMCGVE